jgi:SAM-dependent methyltransferase
MNDSSTMLQSAAVASHQDLAWLPAKRQRSPFRLSDIWRAPLTDLPIRDEILYQYLPLSQEMEVLEIGPGTGFTAFCLARLVKRLTIVDVAAVNIERLQKALSIPNVELVAADVCAPGLATMLRRKFDVVEAVEVLEFLPDPAIALQNMGATLRHGGRLFLQFPNYRPPRSHGVTYFERWADLHNLLQAAGFKNCEVYSLRLRPYSEFLFRNLHEKPLNFYRWLRRNERPNRPQTFENVWTFQHGARLEKYRCVLHLAWMMLMGACRWGGDCFTRTPVAEDIMDKNLLIIAER